MITHRCRLTKRLRTACLLTLFLLTLTSISPAQQLMNVDVAGAPKDLKDRSAGVRADAARGLVLLAVKPKKTPNLALLQPDVTQQHTVVTAAQVTGTWEYRLGKSRFNTIRIRAIAKQRLKVEFVGLYTYPLPDGTSNMNTGEGQSIAIIEGTQATFKPEEAEDECLITMNFTKRVLKVEQKGICGFGLNVNLTGT